MSKRIKRDSSSNIYILPIAFVVSIVPLIVFMKMVSLTPIESQNWYGKPTYADFFNYYKSQWLIAGTATAVVFYLIHSIVKRFELKKGFLYIPACIYAVLIILSSVMSEHSKIAINGFVARYEGMIALLCYLALMIVTYNLVNTESHIKFILGILLVSSLVISIVGLFQFLGYDLYKSAFGKLLILPKEYHNLADTLTFRFEKSVVYSTFSNSNYIGSYMVMVIPIAFFSYFYFKKTVFKIGSALLTLLLLINLFGSRSRAGMVGLAVTVLLAVVIFRKALFRRKLIVGVTLAGVLILFAGMNIALNGVLLQRIFSEFTNTSNQKFFDLQDIVFGDKRVSIVSSTETLIIRQSDESRLYFYDSDDKALDYNISDNNGTKVIKFTDPKYKNYILTLTKDIINVKNKHAEFKLRAAPDTFKLIGNNGDETSNINKPVTLGFEGKERLGSARGYIWSRTLPMLKDTLLLGYGPDTYPIKFPQNDYIGKIRAYGTAFVIVDKPHDIYLQVAVGSGVVSLLAVLTLWGFYIVQSIRLYINNIDFSLQKLSGAAMFIAVSGYLSAGFFNDSVVGISPIFWVLLGLGFACNLIIKLNQIKVRSR